MVLVDINQNKRIRLPMIPEDLAAPVELLLSGRDLKSQDYMSKADPFVKVFLQTASNGPVNEVGRTQAFANEPNPDWKTRIPVEFFFEVKQIIRFEVYDEDSATVSKLIGKVETQLGNIMGSPKQHKELDIKDDADKVTGKLIIRAEKLQTSKYNVRMKWRGGAIANMDSYFSFWDKSDPYLKFSKIRADGTTIEGGRTEVLMNNQQPNWKQVEIPSARLFSKYEADSKFKVECWDFDEKTEHKLVGSADITVKQLQDFKSSGKPKLEIALTNPNMNNPGTIILEKYEKVQAPFSFIDYIRSGLKLSLAVAIDFTASNVQTGLGVTDNPDSLHFLSNQPNQYQRVLTATWDIIRNYDADKKIPALGFGGIPHFPGLNDVKVSHCFPLTGLVQQVEITGLSNLLDAYGQSLKHVELSGPTHFVPVIEKAYKVAEHFKNKFEYQVLLILTDGTIHDMEETKNLIVKNAMQPMSIIVVGIGNEDFSNMYELSKEIADSKGNKSPRDIVQFVPFNKFGGNAVVLSKEILREIPDQVVKYMQLLNKEPEVKK